MNKKVLPLLVLITLLTVCQLGLSQTPTITSVLTVDTWFKYSISYLWLGTLKTDNITVKILDINTTHIAVNWTGQLIVYIAIARKMSNLWLIKNGFVPPFWLNVTLFTAYLSKLNFSIVLPGTNITGPEIYIHSYNKTFINMTVVDYGLKYSNGIQTITKTEVTSFIKTDKLGIIQQWESKYTRQTNTTQVKNIEQKTEIGKLLAWKKPQPQQEQQPTQPEQPQQEKPSRTTSILTIIAISVFIVVVVVAYLKKKKYLTF